MASPRITLETASRDELIGFVKKLEARRRQVESKLKGKYSLSMILLQLLLTAFPDLSAELKKGEEIKQVLERYSYPVSDAGDLDATLNHTQLKVTESNKCTYYDACGFLVNGLLLVLGLDW